jgi:hypothetical protein
MDVAKVDGVVAYVAMVCTRILQASVSNVPSFFQTYVASVFIWMLRMCCNGFQVFFHMFLQMFQTHVLSVSSVFFCMLQVLHLDVSK